MSKFLGKKNMSNVVCLSDNYRKAPEFSSNQTLHSSQELDNKLPQKRVSGPLFFASIMQSTKIFVLVLEFVPPALNICSIDFVSLIQGSSLFSGHIPHWRVKLYLIKCKPPFFYSSHIVFFKGMLYLSYSSRD